MVDPHNSARPLTSWYLNKISNHIPRGSSHLNMATNQSVLQLNLKPPSRGPSQQSLVTNQCVPK